MILGLSPPHSVMTAIAPVVPGCVVRTRLIGGIEAEQKEKGEDWTKNDRLITVATYAQTYQNAKTLSDLRPHLVEEIIFFVDYNRLRDRKFKRRAPLWGRAKPTTQLKPA